MTDWEEEKIIAGLQLLEDIRDLLRQLVAQTPAPVTYSLQPAVVPGTPLCMICFQQHSQLPCPNLSPSLGQPTGVNDAG